MQSPPALLELSQFTLFAPWQQQQPLLGPLNLKIAHADCLLICAPSGAGKSSLARWLARTEEEPSHWKWSGKALLFQKPWDSVGAAAFRSRVAAVWQNPAPQLVCPSVAEEIAMALSHAGWAPEIQRRRVTEAAELLNCAHLLKRHPATLSSGEQQRVALAAAAALRPDLLILDEPASRLDPVAASHFYLALGLLREWLGTAVLLFESSPSEAALGLATRAAFLNQGQLHGFCDPASFPAWLDAHHPGFLPPIAAWFRDSKLPSRPFSMAQAREALSRPGRNADPKEKQKPSPTSEVPNAESDAAGTFSQPERAAPRISFSALWWSWPGSAPVFENLNIEFFPGEIVCLMGPNGAGKSSLLRLLARPSKLPQPAQARWQSGGSSIPEGAIAWVPQQAQDMLWAGSVADEWLALAEFSEDKEPPFRLRAAQELWAQPGPARDSRHPRSLCAGDRQLLALALCIGGFRLLEGGLLLLDEPTWGLDPPGRARLGKVLRKLALAGTSLFVATQDANWAATIADRVAMLHSGTLLGPLSAEEFWSEGLFYVPVSRRLSHIGH